MWCGVFSCLSCLDSCLALTCNCLHKLPTWLTLLIINPDTPSSQGQGWGSLCRQVKARQERRFMQGKTRVETTPHHTKNQKSHNNSDTRPHKSSLRIIVNVLWMCRQDITFLTIHNSMSTNFLFFVLLLLSSWLWLFWLIFSCLHCLFVSCACPSLSFVFLFNLSFFACLAS